MIKLERAEKPTFLTKEKANELTETFKRDGSSVWKDPAIKESLMSSSHKKCAFCECSISDESKYMEVEHFECKDIYHDKVVEWHNLLPACKRCNIAKGTHDVIKEPIINPYDINPKEHIRLKLYRLKGTTPLGASTIEALDLNNSDRLVIRRFEVGEQVISSIAIAQERLELYIENPITRRRNKLIGVIETILQECQPSAVYSATTATVAFGDDDFLELIQKIKEHNLWQDHLEQLFIKASQIALRNA